MVLGLFFRKKRIISFEDSVYVSNYIYTIPSFFKKGFLEMQFSVPEGKLFNLVKSLKNLFHHWNVFPVFFIIKKLILFYLIYKTIKLIDETN